jgi:hypothetical protein
MNTDQNPAQLNVELLEERIAPGFAFGSVNLGSYTFDYSYSPSMHQGVMQTIRNIRV